MQAAPQEIALERNAIPEFTPHFIRGIERFNAREFWEAHEEWEEIWLAAQSDVEQFLQGLIQIAAAYHHMQRGTFRGGVRLFDSGMRRLEAFAPDFCGLDRTEIDLVVPRHRAWAASCQREERLDEKDYPQLRLSRGVEGAVPPITPW